jgi:hypothetical protein
VQPLISARIWTRSLASRLESGSSKRKTCGLADDGAADGHALALAAGEGLGLAFEEDLVDAEDGGRLGRARSISASWHLAQLEPKAMLS